MKNISLVLSSLALIGVLILFGLHFSGKKSSAHAEHSTATFSLDAGASRIAYVDIDTFEAHYEYLKTKRADFTKRQESMQAELERSARQLQDNAKAYQQKIQSGTMTQAEGEATEKKLMQMQQSLQLREQSLTEQLLKEKDEFNNSLHEMLENFLSDYNKDKKFDYILSYSQTGSPILFTNKNLDITQDVIDGMNERSKNIGDSTKKK